MKRFISILCAAALAASLAACASPAADDSISESGGSTLTGQITALEGAVATLQLGELAEGGAPSGGQAPADGAPQGEAPADPPSDGQAPADGAPQGEAAGDSEAPAAPGGDAQAPEGTQGQTPPALPQDATGAQSGADGGAAPKGTAPEGGPGGASFTPGGETTSVDLSGAALTREGSGGAESITPEALAVGDILTVQLDGSGAAVSAVVRTASGASGAFGGSGTVTQGTAANTIDANGAYENETYTSEGDDENALRVDGAAATLTGIVVNKTGGASSNTEDGDFYGQNAALLATNGANVTIENAVVTSAAQNGNGVFSYGEGTVVTISDSTITTTADNSGGIQTTGGGTTIASGLTVDTAGSSSAAIRSDRGGGTVTVDGGTYTTRGYNSPAVYSTADITVKNAVLTAENSEALVIEGHNSIALENCEVSGNMSDTQGSSSDENVHNVMIYQSMSGDAEVGTSSLTLTGGSLTGRSGDLFYVTNTHCVLTLSGVALANEDADACLLRVTGNSGARGWGSAGANGGQAEVTADGQVLEGDVVVDTVSTLHLTLTGASTFTGTVNIVDNAEGGAAVADNAVVTVEAGSTWTLTGNCTLTSLTNNGTVQFNGYTITLADGTVLQ